MSDAGDTYQIGEGLPWIAKINRQAKEREMNSKCDACFYSYDSYCENMKCNGLSEWKPKVKEEASGWRRFEDEMPEREKAVWLGRENEASKCTFSGGSAKDAYRISDKRWNYWQYAVVPEPPMEEVKRADEIEKVAPGFAETATCERITDKINEIIDAINAMRSSK